MVDFTDLQRAAELGLEKDSIIRAIENLDGGGRIVRMVVSDSEEATVGTDVDTSYMQTPPQMIDAIKSQFHDRLDQIASELSGMGVTGIQPQPRTGRR